MPRCHRRAMDGQDPGPSRPRPHAPNRGSQTRPPAGPPHCGKTDCGIRAVNAGCRHPPAPGPWPQHIWTLARCCWPRAQWQKAFPGDYSKVSWEGSSSTQIPNRRPEAGAGPKNPTPRSLSRAHPVAGEPCSGATPPCSLPGHCKLPESQESPSFPVHLPGTSAACPGKQDVEEDRARSGSSLGVG